MASLLPFGDRLDDLVDSLLWPGSFCGIEPVLGLTDPLSKEEISLVVVLRQPILPFNRRREEYVAGSGGENAKSLFF